MPIFIEAFDSFKLNGCFHLNDTFINLRQLEDLKEYIRDNFSRISQLPSRQLHLSQVELIPYYAEEMCEAGGPAKSLYRGRIEVAENLLLTILDFSKLWDSIQLNEVYSCLNERIKPLNPNFFANLKSNSNVLKKLTIKTGMLTQESLINILDLFFALDVLSLELDWSTSPYDWQRLRRSFVEHSHLKCLDFGTISLDMEAYTALSELLDENYRIERISLAEPVGDPALMEIYEQINQRLSESCWIRFKKEQLSQQRLMNLALHALDDVKTLRIEQQKGNLNSWDKKDISKLNKRFDFLLNSQSKLALVSHEKEEWLKKDGYTLPRVYRDYSFYVKEHFALFQLHLDTFIPTHRKTVGYFLLEKALETKNEEAMEALLKANVNLFEIPPPPNTEEPFLKRALQGRRRCPIKKLLLSHIRKNSSLMELAVGHFSEHSELHNVLKELIDHLSKYGDILIHKNDLSGLYFFTKDVVNLCRKMFGLESPSEKRGEEYAGFQLGLYESIQVATVNGQERPNPDSLSHMQTIVREMIEMSSSALRGFSNGSELHVPMLIILKKLDIELGKITGITDDPIEQASIIAKYRNDLRAKDATIHGLIERMKEQKVEMEARHKQEQEEMQARLAQERVQERAQERARQAQERAQQAQERAQERAQQAQEQEEMQARHAREKGELEEQIEMLGNLVEQNRMMNRDTLSEERPRSNASFFPRW